MILRARGSFASYLFFRILDEYATTAAAEDLNDEKTERQARTIFAFEIICEQSGMSCSFYPRHDDPWNKMDF